MNYYPNNNFYQGYSNYNAYQPAGIPAAAMFSYNVYLSLEQEEVIADIIATYGEEIINVTNKVFKKLQLI